MPDTRQHLVLTGGSPGGVWACASCHADLCDGLIAHRRDCEWLARLDEGDRQLLADAADALWGCAKSALTVKPNLDHPYPEMPEWSPWTRWVEAPARTAHDVRQKIRAHLRSQGDTDARQR